MFPVLSANDLYDSLVAENYLEDEDKGQFKEAHNGDPLMSPFQCDECHIYNMKGRKAIVGYFARMIWHYYVVHLATA